MMLTPLQQRIVEENMGLVAKVIKDKVHGLGQPGTPAYEDLYQTGCIGLCKAVATDKGGCFSTYAYRLIWNEICDELIRTTRLTQREQSAEVIERCPMNEQAPDMLEGADLRAILEQAKKTAPSATEKGIRCLELTVQGYNSQEIGRIMKAEAATVRMWMSRARQFLREIPELQSFLCSEGAA